MPKLPKLEPKLWIVWIPEVAGPSVVESYTKGQAVEFFLACHGLLSYDKVLLYQLDGIHLINEVSGLVPYKNCLELDDHHHPTVVKEWDGCQD